jgi:hypothetical protein
MIEAAKVDQATYAKALAAILGGLVCSDEPDRIYVLRRLLQFERLRETGAEMPTNAYASLPPSQWRGYFEPPPAPPPEPGTWGDHPPLPPVIDQAAADLAAGSSHRTVLRAGKAHHQPGMSRLDGADGRRQSRDRRSVERGGFLVQIPLIRGNPRRPALGSAGLEGLVVRI